MTRPRRSNHSTKSSGRRRSARRRIAIRCVIFDLDDTLYDCLALRVRPAHRHAAEAMVKAGIRATVAQVYRARLRAFRTDPMLRHIDAEVCRIFQSEQERNAAISR